MHFPDVKYVFNEKKTKTWFYRYFILTIQLHIPETTDEGINEAALAKGTVSELSVIIMLKYLEKVFDTLLRSKQQEFTQTGEIGWTWKLCNM